MLPPIGYVLNKLKLPMHYVAHLYRPSIAEFRVVQGLAKKEPKPNDSRLLLILKELTQSVEKSMDETDIAKLLDRSGLSSVDTYLYQSTPSVRQIVLSAIRRIRTDLLPIVLRFRRRPQSERAVYQEGLLRGDVSRVLCFLLEPQTERYHRIRQRMPQTDHPN